MKHLFTTLVTVLTLLMAACDNNEPESSLSGCDRGKVVKKAKNRAGQVSFIPSENSYLIQYAEPGTYDSVDMGYTCNLPEEFKQAGLKVIFSGDYRKYPVASPLGGYTNYYLELTDIALK
jgi:hypothetical protein